MPRDIKNVRYDFDGHTVLITGGSRGQGRSHALAFAAAGANIAICEPDRQLDSVHYPLGGADDLNATAADIAALGVACVPAICDVRDGAQVRAMVGDVEDELGGIDVLINNAGIDTVYSLADLSEQSWDETVDTNLKGVFLCSKAVTPGMIERGRGKILMTASALSLVGSTRHAHYVASKHGVLGLVRALAIELAPHRINVNAVCPGGIDTPMVSGLLQSAEGEWLEQLGDLTGPWNLFDPSAMLQPEEITAAMLWLASDAADFVTGTHISVDAGFTIK